MFVKYEMWPTQLNANVYQKTRRNNNNHCNIANNNENNNDNLSSLSAWVGLKIRKENYFCFRACNLYFICTYYISETAHKKINETWQFYSYYYYYIKV